MKRSKDEDKEDNQSLNMSAGSNSNEAGTSAVRTTGRVKKPKQVYDPSDNYISRGARNSMPSNSGQITAPVAPAAAATATTTTTAPAVASTPTSKASGSVSGDGPSSSSGGEVSPIIPDQPPQQQPPPQRNFDTCTKCGKSEPRRGSGHKSNYITCKSCLQKCHYACLIQNFENLSLARKKYKCNKCRFCQVCSIKSKDLLVCTGCVEVYHTDCHKPLVKSAALTDPKWKCRKCDANYNQQDSQQQQQLLPRKSQAGRKKRSTSQLQEESLPAAKPGKSSTTPPKKETQPEAEIQEQQEEAIDKPEDKRLGTLTPPPPPTKPPPASIAGSGDEMNVASWSVDQVVHFVAKHYPSEAEVFRYQDINGAALLLLTRQDIVNSFGLKLGPSLRLFELVMGLQNRADDIRLAWFD